MEFRNESEEERALREALDHRRAVTEDALDRMLRMRKYVQHNPEGAAKLEETIAEFRQFLDDDARERNLGNVN